MSKTAIIITVALVIAAAGAVWYFGFRKKEEPKKDAPATPPAK